MGDDLRIAAHFFYLAAGEIRWLFYFEIELPSPLRVVRLEVVLEGPGWFAHGVPSEPEAGFDMFGVNAGTVAYRFVLPFYGSFVELWTGLLVFRCRFVT